MSAGDEAQQLEAPPTPRRCQRRNRVLLASVVFSFVGIGSAHFPVVVLKVLSEELDWPRSIPSTAYALMYISGGLGGVLMGWLLDRFGMTIPAFSGATAIGVSALVSSIIDRPWQLYGTSILVGLLGRSSIFVPLTTNIMRWFEDNKSFAVGVVGSGGMIGGAVWPLIFEHLVEAFSWRKSSQIYGILVLALNLPIAMVLRQAPPTAAVVPAVSSSSSSSGGNQAAGDSSPRAPLSPRMLTCLLSVAAVCCCVAMSLPLAHLLAHVSDIGYEPARGAEILSLTLTGASFSSFFGVGYLGKKLGAASTVTPWCARCPLQLRLHLLDWLAGGLRALMVFVSAQAIYLAFFTFIGSLPALYVNGVLFGLGYGGVLLCYPIIVRELMPAAEAGRRTGIIALCASGAAYLVSNRTWAQ